VRTSSIWTRRAKTAKQPLPLSRLASDVLKERKKEQASESPFVLPRPRSPGKPIHSVKRACLTALKNAVVRYFPIYNLRHVFCTRLSWVAPDAVAQRAMRHSTPETKWHYQLGMVDQVRNGIEQASKRAYKSRLNHKSAASGVAYTQTYGAIIALNWTEVGRN
jgi:integrase